MHIICHSHSRLREINRWHTLYFPFAAQSSANNRHTHTKLPITAFFSLLWLIFFHSSSTKRFVGCCFIFNAFTYADVITFFHPHLFWKHFHFFLLFMISLFSLSNLIIFFGSPFFFCVLSMWPEKKMPEVKWNAKNGAKEITTEVESKSEKK